VWAEPTVFGFNVFLRRIFMTSKQRAYLKSLAGKIEPVFHVGKNGVTPEIVKAVDEVLEARELVKGTVLNNCMEEIGEVSQTIAERTSSEVVQVIGKKIVLFKRAKKNPSIDIDRI